MNNLESKENKSINTNYILIIRHGERIDENLILNKNNSKTNQKCPTYDPELTLKGKKQVIDIVKQALSNIDKNIKKINVYSSPFTRTLETSIKLIHKINEYNFLYSPLNSNLILVEGLSEFYSEKYYKYDPTNELLVKNRENKNYEDFIGKNISKYNINLVSFENKNDIKANYPESFDDVVKRYRNISNILYNEIINQKNCLNIIVTHGYGVHFIAQSFLGRTEDNKNLIEKKHICIDYCSTFYFKINEKGNCEYINYYNPKY